MREPRRLRLQAWAMAKQLEQNPSELTAAEGADIITLNPAPEQIRALSRADVAIKPNSLPIASPAHAMTKAPADEPVGWRAIVFYVSIASLLSGGLTYLATMPGQSVEVGPRAVVQRAAPKTEARTVALPAVESPPVRFTNPFDATEVFEFPPGTSEAEARQAVAAVLLQRARDRQRSWSKVTYERTKQPLKSPLSRHAISINSVDEHRTDALPPSACICRDQGGLSHG